MKKYLIPVLLLVVLVSCSDDIESNTPSIQGIVNKQFFRASDASGETSQGGSVTLTGTDAAQTITLKTESTTPGIYELGENPNNVATFETIDSLFYSTGTIGNGQIEITDKKDGKISGTFYFNARVNGTTGDTLNFNKGSFFSVPITGMSAPPVVTNCEEATTVVDAALTTYNDALANGTAEDIQQACQAYKTALEGQIEACGDESGNIQAIIDGLDC